MISHSSVRCGGMAHMTGVLKWMATGYSGEIRREKEEMGVFLYIRGGLECMELIYGDERV